MKYIRRIPILMLILMSVSGCNTFIERASRMGNSPGFSEIDLYNNIDRYNEISCPVIQAVSNTNHSNGSLWVDNNTPFMNTKKQYKIGDIIKVKIKFSDKAEFENKTKRQRKSDENLNAKKVFGLQNMFKTKNTTADSSKILDIEGKSKMQSDGFIDRKEEVNTDLPVIIVKNCDNGLLFISGKQEIEVNYEMREIAIQGIIKAEDISSEKTIDSSRVAEARIKYGGKGQVTDIQKPRWGLQIIDLISPF